MEKDYAIEVNAAMVYHADDYYTLGIHINDSDGMNLDTEVETDDLNECFESAYAELMDDYFDYLAYKEEKEAEETKQAEEDKKDRTIEDLKNQNKLLEMRLDSLMEKLSAANDKIDNYSKAVDLFRRFKF